MFTGYIEHCGKLLHIEEKPQGKRFIVETRYQDILVGESICVSGICLTAVSVAENQFVCDLSPETLALTNADTWQVGCLVNLERSLQINDRLNGHFVMGHIDQTCIVDTINQQADFWALSFSGILSEAAAFLVKKGSIAINGVSLTINAVNNDAFEVMLIPETLSRTNLQSLQVGDTVNIEYDYLAKIIAKQVMQNSVANFR